MSLTLICGPMFAGKTRTLIELVRAAGASAVAAKPDVDTRFGSSVIVSHDGLQLPAKTVSSVAELGEAVAGATLVAVDEVQFLSLELAEALVELGARMPVVAAGLDLDFRTVPFESTTLLEEHASSVRRLSSTCGLCGGAATRTQRLADGVPVRLSDPVVKIGGTDLYEPRCVACWSAERAPSDAGLSFAQADGAARLHVASAARRGSRSRG
jgi:thymidine kinase